MSSLENFSFSAFLFKIVLGPCQKHPSDFILVVTKHFFFLFFFFDKSRELPQLLLIGLPMCCIALSTCGGDACSISEKPGTCLRSTYRTGSSRSNSVCIFNFCKTVCVSFWTIYSIKYNFIHTCLVFKFVCGIILSVFLRIEKKC